MLESLLFFILLLAALFLVFKSADFAIKYSTKLASSFCLPKYVIGFLVVAVISILPEAFISITSAIEGVPAFGLGTLFGSNVADLTLVFALVVLLTGRDLKIDSKIIKNRFLYICVLALPILLGLNGVYSRWEGALLVVAGLSFFLFILRGGQSKKKVRREKFRIRNLLFLLASMAVLLVGANFTVKFGVDFANNLKISPILIGMFVVGWGTVLPEMMFSIKAAKNKHDGLALGDLLGTVIADATIIVGIMTLVNPFSLNPRIIYITGIFMVLAIVLLLYLMKTGKKLTRREAILLMVFYLIFVVTELITSNIIVPTIS